MGKGRLEAEALLANGDVRVGGRCMACGLYDDSDEDLTGLRALLNERARIPCILLFRSAFRERGRESQLWIATIRSVMEQWLLGRSVRPFCLPGTSEAHQKSRRSLLYCCTPGHLDFKASLNQ